MPFIETPAEETATGATVAMYERTKANFGYLPNMVRAFGHRPEVMDGWNALLGAIRGNLDLRRYELATLAAARALKSSYCMLAHGSVLLDEGMTPQALRDIVEDRAGADLTAQERSIMDYAAKIASDATTVTQGDIDTLRNQGLSDAEIFDIAATAAMRCFFSKLLDGLGAQPDAAYMSIKPELRSALTPGRAIDA
ncbi:MAG: peroxidase-related enzyme [Paracoccaceae bacterium]|nr:peroxidase-related enzyme [Paracoccaceae bacterium]MDH5531442.1 peroxidase-related enzyme [Paracoccaceae bacterium]